MPEGPTLKLRVSELKDVDEFAHALDMAADGGLVVVPLADVDTGNKLLIELRLAGFDVRVRLIASVVKRVGDRFCCSVRTEAPEGLVEARSRLAARSPMSKRQALPVGKHWDITSSPSLDGRDPLLGRCLSGKYEIEQLLGSGAAGKVYRARHLALDRKVAVKVLHSTFVDDKVFIERFHREALAASRLDHPNALRVIDYSEERDDGLLYIVMELLAGRTLRDVVDREAPLPLKRIVDIGAQVCGALAAAHQQGIVHRDIKPENIVLVPSRDDEGVEIEVAKVCDFGIAKLTAIGTSARPPSASPALRTPQATSDGALFGTPDYMSPEQANAQAVDARSDLYSLAVVLYEMATGRVPFPLDSQIAVLLAHIAKEPPPPSSICDSVDPRLEAVVLKGLRKDPDARHQNARELRAELRALIPSMSLGGPSAPLPVSPLAVTRPAPSMQSIDLGSDDHTPASLRLPSKSLVTLPRTSATAIALKGASPSAEVSVEVSDIDSVTDVAAYSKACGELVDAVVAGALAGEIEPLHALLLRIYKHAKTKTPPGRDQAATKLLRRMVEPNVLMSVATTLLQGTSGMRYSALGILSAAGAPGVRALGTARKRLSSDAVARARFVDAVREIGAAAVPTLCELVAAIEPQGSDEDLALVEDVLKGGPPTDARLAPVAGKMLQARVASVRKAATALSGLLGAGSRKALLGQLHDTDDAVRVEALSGLRTLGQVDFEVVTQADAILLREADVSDELRAVTVAVLAHANEGARQQAFETLSALLMPRARSFVGAFFRPGAEASSPLVEAAARSMLTLDGAKAKRVIEARIARTTGTLRDSLKAMLEQPEGAYLRNVR